MFAPRFIITGKEAQQGLFFEVIADQEKPFVKIHIGKYGKQLLDALPWSIKAIAD